MQFETVVLVMILVLAVTIAWFIMSKLANVAGINAKVAVVTDDIRISMTEDEAEEGPDNSILITGKSNHLMPGGTGEFDFWITSLKAEVTGATITPLELLCAYRDGVQDDGKNEVLGYLKKHIIFHMQVGESDDEALYNPEENKLWSVDLDKDTPVHIRIKYRWEGILKDNPLCKDSGITEHQYNREDTMIGSRVDSISFSLRVASLRTTSTGE